MRLGKWRWLMVPVAGLAIAWLANMGVVGLFGESSQYRIQHGLVGMIFLVIYTWKFRTSLQFRQTILFFMVAVIPVYLGTAFPDLDISLLGIGGHRNPFFHSSFIYLILIWVFRNPSPLYRYAMVGLGL